MATIVTINNYGVEPQDIILENITSLKADGGATAKLTINCGKDKFTYTFTSEEERNYVTTELLALMDALVVITP